MKDKKPFISIKALPDDILLKLYKNTNQSLREISAELRKRKMM